MIGVNTFVIGGSSDSALSYSLSLGEAESFIRLGVSSLKKIQTTSSKFPAFLQSIDAFTQ